ncbi:MAG: hypothetical protein JW863_08940 [Chitinispirillaceae bacterium]|nr:hypothetical protein [Chitinispirillaceae bacterium]
MQMNASIYSRTRAQSGGIRFRVLIVLVTLCIVGFAIYQLLHTLGQNQQTNHRKALAISEYGLMMALQEVPSGATPPSAIARTEYDEGWYQVTVKNHSREDTLFCTVTSVGHFGSATERRECILRLEISDSDTSWIRKSMR